MGSNLFNILGGSSLPPNMKNLLSQFQQFKQGFNGDPRQQIQQLLNSGRISQNDYNNAVKMANELSKYLK